ncbi:hypothetical protein J7M23_04760 [Candidatus Sumerlaeota bacterium]|nr:hypothetical protein [Candidatus Sumerlaeota bacterium]
MIETKIPRGKKFPLPEKEPICRVGIVLESDNKSRMEIVLPEGEFKITGDGKEKILKCDTQKPLSVKVSNGKVICEEPKVGTLLLSSSGVISIQRTDGKEVVAPQSGILLKRCRIGRGFHWQKEVDLYYPGKLEFHNWNSKLVVVNEIHLEPYLYCVVTSEMSSMCPPEFIKAQTTAARSWTIVNLKDKHKGVPYTICNDDCCQRYQGTTYLASDVVESAEKTRGMFLVTENGDVCSAFYSKCCGGIIEKGSNIFGKSALGLSDTTDAPPDSPTARFNPITEENVREWILGDWIKKSDSFCSPNVCPEAVLPKYLGAVDEARSYYRWKVVYTQEEIVELLKEKAHLDDIAEFLGFRPGFRGNSGRLHQLEIVYRTDRGEKKTFTVKRQYTIRKILHKKFLYSSAFVWDYEKDTKGKITKVILYGAGWGHGAGLCQMGALGMALKGYTYQQILKHYYNKTTLVKAY